MQIQSSVSNRNEEQCYMLPKVLVEYAATSSYIPVVKKGEWEHSDLKQDALRRFVSTAQRLNGQQTEKKKGTEIQGRMTGVA